MELLTLFIRLLGVLSIISGQGVFGVRPHAKNTRLPRFIEMILYLLSSNCGLLLCARNFAQIIRQNLQRG